MKSPRRIGGLFAVCTAFMVVGCTYSVRSVSGKVYGPNLHATDQALLDSGSINLHCAPSQVRGRYLVGSPDGDTILVAEGCGQRALYAKDCRRQMVPVKDRPPASPARKACFQGGFGTEEDCRNEYPEITCELVLISKVALE